MTGAKRAAAHTARLVRWRQATLPALMLLAFALTPLYAALAGERYVLDLATRIMIFGIAAVALNLVVGYGGLIAFGHAAFIGLGAYAVGILSANGIGDLLVSLPAGVAAAGVFALITGFVCVRTKGAYFIMITLAFAQMAYFIATSLAAYGGDNGLTIAARDTVAGLPLLKSDRALYYFILVCLAATYAFSRTLFASRFGRVLRGTKENPVRMETIGFNPTVYRLIAYVISGGFGGLAGVLLANAAEFVSPAYMSWERSGELIVMVILGGVGSADGAIIGSAVYLLSEEWLSRLTENWQVIFGPFLILIVLFARGGLIGLARRFSVRASATAENRSRHA
jgi:branched-chain amino acid transport system permease protein